MKLDEDRDYQALPEGERAKVRQKLGREVPSPPKLVPIYTKESLPKINAMREAISTVVSKNILPILDEADVGFVTAEHLDNKPCGCGTCALYNVDAATCMIHGDDIEIKRFRYPAKGEKQVDYFPVCGEAVHGKPHKGLPVYLAEEDPDSTGLGYANAPELDQKYGGVNCGGSNGADDCDFMIVEGNDKRKAKTGFCRVLQKEVANGAVCRAWRDDDWIDWRKAKQLMEEIERSSSSGEV